jgi:hypothetical protein
MSNSLVIASSVTVLEIADTCLWTALFASYLERSVFWMLLARLIVTSVLEISRQVTQVVISEYTDDSHEIHYLWFRGLLLFYDIFTLGLVTVQYR